jgi:hypothetical protein
VDTNQIIMRERDIIYNSYAEYLNEVGKMRFDYELKAQHDELVSHFGMDPQSIRVERLETPVMFDII